MENNQNTQEKNSNVISTPTGIQAKPQEPLRVGIISSETNKENIFAFRDVFLAINNRLGERVQLIVFGHYSDDQDGNWLKEVDFEFVKPVSIVHYFKQLRALNLDLIFIPLLRTPYNIRSETLGKFFEGAVFNIPVLAPRFFPYNNGDIVDKHNGFLYENGDQIVLILDHLYIQRPLVKAVGRNAHNFVMQEFNYSNHNIKLLADSF